ncbi:MAG TPA: secretin N-terminal domain-containing protein [Phycisphaerae bacterium]|nr:secretin N-terminal domain-containing protein [Phycisphaerae bacterium]
MTIRQGNAMCGSRRLAMMALLAVGGLGLLGLRASLAQPATESNREQAQREARQTEEQIRIRDRLAARAASRPAGGSNRPGSMREYNERRAAAQTQPADEPSAPEMKIQAGEIEAVDEEHLAELEAKARAEARAGSGASGAPATRPVPSQQPRPTSTRPTPGSMTPPIPPRPPVRPPIMPPSGQQPAPGAPTGATTPPTGATGTPAGAAAAPAGPTAITPSTSTTPGSTTAATTPGGPLAANPVEYWNLPPEDRLYIISWNDTPLSKTLQDISDFSGLTVVTSLIQKSELDTKKITFQGVRTYSYDEMLTTYNMLLFDLNYWVVHRGDYLVIRALSEWYRHIPPDHMFSTLEEYLKAKLPKWEVASVVYEPRYELPETLATVANDLVPLNGARAVIQPSSGRVQLTGFVYFIDDQLDILKKWDVKQDPEPRPLRTYTLQYTSVEDAARMLRAMLPTSGGAVPVMAPTPTPTPGAPGARPPTPAAAGTVGSSMNDIVEIQEDSRSNRLVIKATPFKHELVKEYLEKYIDLPLDPNQTKAKLFKLKYANPDQIVETIRPLLGKTMPVAVPTPAPGTPGGQPRPPGAPPAPGQPQQVVHMTTTVGTTAVIMPFPQSNSILVKANKDEMVQIEQYIQMLDVDSPKSYEYIKLQHANASSVAGVLREVLSSGPRRVGPGGVTSPGQVQFQASADPSNDKVLVLRGEPQDIADAKELIQQLDVDPAADAVEHVVQLKDADPEVVADVLRSRYSESGGGSRRYSPYGGYGGGGSSGSSLPRFIAETRTKTLIVVSTSDMWTDIERLIRDLDERSRTKNVTRVYRLKHATPANMAEILGQTLGGMSSSGRWGRRSYYGSYGGGESSDAPSFQYSPNSDALIITASDEVHQKASELISELDQPTAADKAQPRAIQLAKADATYVAEMIENMFEESGGRRRSYSYYSPYGGGNTESNKVPVRVVAEEITNRVFVTASDEDFKKAEELARSIDAEYEKQEIIRKTFVLQHADPADLRNILESMFENASGGSRAGRRRGGYDYYYGGYDYGGRGRSNASKPGAIQLIDTLDSIIVMAPKDKMEQIEQVIKELDTDSSGSNQIKTYKIENVGYEGTAGIARNLSELFSEGGRSDYGRRASGSGKIKFIGEYGSDILMVSAPANKMAEVDQKVQEILKLKTTTDLSFEIRHFDVDQARPEDIVEIIEPLLESKFEELQQKSSTGRFRGWFGGGGNTPRVTAHKNARRIMVSAPASLMPLVEELLKEFDKAPTPSTTKIITLKTGKAADIVPAVQQAMDEKASSGSSFRSRGRRSWFPWGGYGGMGDSNSSSDSGLQITAIESSNLIMLRGPMTKVAEAEKLIQQLDAQATGDGPIINVYKIQHADLYEVAEMIEDMVGGGSGDSFGYRSSYGSRRSRSGAGASLVVKTDYANSTLIVSASREMIPMIEQIIDLKDRQPEEETRMADSKLGRAVTGAGRGEIAMCYDIKKGDVNETAKRLDSILLTLFGYDAPYVKAFPYANQIIVTGKPEHFKEVENWIKKFEEKPVEPRYVISFLALDVSPVQVINTLEQSLPTDQREKVVIQPVPSLGRRDPLKEIKELHWYDPIKTSAPAGSTDAGARQVGGASPFVPTNELNELRSAVSALGLAQARVTPATRPATTTRPAATRPAGGPTTRPAVAANPEAEPPLQVLARPSTRRAAAPAAPQAAAPAPAPKASSEPKAPAAPAPSPDSAVARTAGPDPESVPVEDKSDSRAREHKTIMDTALQARESGKLQIRYDEDKKAVYIVGPAQDVEAYQKFIEDIAEQIKKLQGVHETPSDIRVFELTYVDVNIAAAILEQMFNDKVAGQPQQAQPRPAQQPKKPAGAKDGDGEDEESTARRRRQEEGAKEEGKEDRKGLLSGQRIRVFADARTRTIIVRAAEEDFPAIAELILKIDRPGDQMTTEIRVFQLKKLNAYDVEMAIKAVLKIEDPRTRMMMGSPFGSRMGRMGRMGGGGAEDLIEQLQAQMLQVELQANLAAAGAQAQPGQPGVENEGKQLKLNPSKDISLTSDATTNTIIVTAPKEGIALVQKLIDTLEEQTIPVQIKSFPIKHGDAEQVASQLERLFQGGGRGRGGRNGAGFPGGLAGGLTGFEASRSGEVRIASDARTNTLIVRALEPDMSKIEEIISKIDQEELTNKVVLYPVENGNATDMARNLSTIFEAGTGGRGRGAAAGQTIRIAADANTNTILVWAPEAAQKQIGEKIKEIDRQGALPYKPKEIKLTFASASAVAEKLEAIYLGSGGRTRGATNRVKIQGDDNSGTIFVTAPEELLKQIEATIKTLDQPGKIDIRVYELKYAYASEVITQFKEMTTQLAVQMRGRSAGSGALADEQIAASADPRTNSIIVTGSPAAHLIVEKVLKQIDKAPAGDTAITTAMFGLTKSNAQAVARSIAQLYATVQLPVGVPRPVAVAEPSSNVVFVYATKSQLENIKASIINPLEDYQATSDIKEHVFPVKYANVDEMATTLTQYFNSRNQAARTTGQTLSPADQAITIVPDAAGRQLLVSTGENNRKYIEEYLKVHDTPEAAGMGRQVRVFPIKYANVYYTVQAINQAFQPAGKVSDSERVVAIAEAATQQVVVRANAENMKRVDELIKDLDKPEASQSVIETVKIQNQRATELAATITAMIPTKWRIDQRTGRYPVSVTPNDSSNTVLINAPQDQMAVVKELIAKLDSPLGEGDQRTLKPYPVQFADLGSVVTVLNQSFAQRGNRPLRDQVTATPEYGTSTIVVTASAENHAKVESLIKDLDRPDFAGRKTIRPIKLENARASEVANTLTNALRSTGMVRRTTGATTATIQPNDATNILLVTANEQEFKDIEALVKILDVKPDADTERVLRPYPVKYAEVYTVAAAINSAFQQSAASKNIRDTVNAVAEPGTLSVIVMATEENHKKVEELLKQVDKVDTGRQNYAIDVKYADPEDVVTALREIYATSKATTSRGRLPASFTLAPGQRKIMISSYPTEREEIERLVAELDAEEAGAARDTRVIKVQHITPQDMNTILTEFMRRPGQTGRYSARLLGDVKIMIIASANAVVITGPKERLDELEQLALKVDSAAPDDKQGRQVHVVTLRNADPSSVAQVINTAFAKYGQVAEADRVNAVAEWMTNSVVVTATRDKMENEIRKMIEDLDQKPIAGRQTLIPLQHARATELAEVLRQTYQSSRRRSGDMPITIAADSNTNSLLVSANPADIEGIKQMVAELDKPALLPDEELRIIPLKYIEATETLQFLTEYLRKPGVTRGRQTESLAGDVRLQASATMNAIIVSGTLAQIEHVESKLRALDQEVEGAGSAPRLVELKKANATQLARTLTQMFTETARQRQRGRQASSPDLVPTIVADEGSNSLLVRARQTDLQQIIEMAERLDKETAQTAFRIIPLRPGVDVEWWAKEIERTVNQTEETKARQQQGYKAGRVTIGVDYRGPAFMVGGSPELFDHVEQLVQGLINLRGGSFGETAIIIRPQNGNLDAKGVSQIIKNFYDQRNGKRR